MLNWGILSNELIRYFEVRGPDAVKTVEGDTILVT